MQISKAIVGAGVNLSVCRSDIFNHRCKLQSLKIASPFLASAARAYQHIPTYKRTYVERKKWQTALQGEKKTRHNKSGQSYVRDARERGAPLAQQSVVIDCIFMPLIESPFLAHRSLRTNNVFNKSLIITPSATRCLCNCR